MIQVKNIVFIDFTDDKEPFTLAIREKDQEGSYLKFYDVLKDGQEFLLREADEASLDHQVVPNYATYWAQQDINIVEVVPEPYHRLPDLPDLTSFFEKAHL